MSRLELVKAVMPDREWFVEKGDYLKGQIMCVYTPNSPPYECIQDVWEPGRHSDHWQALVEFVFTSIESRFYTKEELETDTCRNNEFRGKASWAIHKKDTAALEALAMELHLEVMG